MAHTFTVHVDLQIVDGNWLWPKFNIEGCNTEAEYEALTEAYGELGALLVRAAKKRESRWMPKGTVTRSHERAAIEEVHRTQWVQLTLVEQLDLE